MLKMEISKAVRIEIVNLHILNIITQMIAHPEKHLATKSIMVSGYGARFSKSSNLLLLSFSLPGLCSFLEQVHDTHRCKLGRHE